MRQSDGSTLVECGCRIHSESAVVVRVKHLGASGRISSRGRDGYGQDRGARSSRVFSAVLGRPPEVALTGKVVVGLSNQSECVGEDEELLL